MPVESQAHRRARALALHEVLAIEYPQARCSLDYASPWQLLVATILAAQCTDERVNKVTPALFARYPSVESFAQAEQAELEIAVHSTGFFRNKAKNILGAARRIVSEHQGRVPDTMDALLLLPGVARKTANVVLGTAFGKNEGVVVDTHVTRLSGRLKLTRHSAPEKIERDLMALLPREIWTDFSHRLVFHGRKYCTARKPDCPACPARDLCPSAGKV